MNSTTIKIDGAKLRQLLESKTGKTIYQIATESGYSKNVISNAIKKGYASSAVQNIARLYDITPDDYKVVETDPEPTEELKGQITFDDLIPFNIEPELFKFILKETIKETVKEAIAEVINSQEYVTTFDPHRQLFTIHTRIKEA